MVPTFALSLSFEGIALLRRGPRGWTQLDHVAAEASDLGAGMARLRARATDAEPDGAAVLLLLPEAQVRYLDLPAPGADEAAAARTAMQGASPYALSELTVDHVTHDGTLYVAAVANETLDEAEAFARAHGFRPVGFAALPPEGAFHGTAVFGAAASWTGPAPTRPQAPAFLVPDQPDPAAPEVSVEPAPTETGSASPESPVPETPPLTFSSRRAAETQPPAPELGKSAAKAAPATKPAPKPSAARDAKPAQAVPALGAAAAATPGAKAPAPAEKPAAPQTKPPAPAGPTAASPSAPTPIAVQGAAFRERILDRARQAEAFAAAQAEDAPPTPPRGRRASRAERRHLAANVVPGGRRGRKAGLALTAALLIALAALAGWSLLGTGDDTAPSPIATLPAPDPAEPQETALADTDAADPAPIDPAAQDEAASDDTALAETNLPLPPRSTETAEDAPEAASGPLTEDEAAATYAATGIWQRAPEQPDRPETGAVEDLYVASIDPGVQQFDAVALPPARGYAPDAPPAEPGLPPPPGVTFTLDDRGLVEATPEGALTPDGHRVYLGAPPATPPLREAALPDDQSAVTPPAAFEGLRPSARPGDIIEQNERATLQGLSRDELASFRPARRPGSAQEQAEIDTPDATAEAVARSLLPAARPQGFSTTVASARQSTPTETAAPPRTVSPDVPTTAEVARAATVRNAVNLSDTALFGIYGAAADRRALVRLPNGNYEKVKVGDRLDGGEVLAIGESELRYRKRGRTITLELPRG